MLKFVFGEYWATEPSGVDTVQQQKQRVDEEIQTEKVWTPVDGVDGRYVSFLGQEPQEDGEDEWGQFVQVESLQGPVLSSLLWLEEEEQELAYEQKLQAVEEKMVHISLGCGEKILERQQEEEDVDSASEEDDDEEEEEEDDEFDEEEEFKEGEGSESFQRKRQLNVRTMKCYDLTNCQQKTLVTKKHIVQPEDENTISSSEDEENYSNEQVLLQQQGNSSKKSKMIMPSLLYSRCLGRGRKHEVQPLPPSATTVGKYQEIPVMDEKSMESERDRIVCFLVELHPKALKDISVAKRLKSQYERATLAKQKVVLQAAIKSAQVQGRVDLLDFLFRPDTEHIAIFDEH